MGQAGGRPAAVTVPERARLLDLARTANAERPPRRMLVRLVGCSEELTVYPPVTPAAIELREQNLGVHFSGGYRMLLSITDGLESRELRLLGHGDAYRLGDASVVVAWDADERADFFAVQRPDGHDERVYRVEVDRPTHRPVEEASDFAAYLRRRLAG